MADRGRKAFPVSSHLCDERWQRHCMDLHKQRLSDMKHRIDNTKPETFDLVLSKGKRQMLDKERQTEVDRENAILLQKMVRIKEQDTRAVFRPWTARSTFQWKAGHYYDPATNTKTLDHINLTSSVSPRSIHYFALTRPGTAPPDVTARLRDMEIQVDNTKLLRAITTMRTHYSNDEFERRHAEESILVSRISNFRGPESAKYQPPGRSISASRNSPYLAPLPGRAASSSRPRPQPRAGWPASAPVVSQQQYFEDAQNRDIPPPSARGSSRPGTAVGGTQEGLGETSPRASGSSRHSSGSSRHSSASSTRDVRKERGSAAGSQLASAPGGSEASSRPGSAAVAAGTSFTFAGKEQEQARRESGSSEPRKSSSSSSSSRQSGASADDYEDEQYEQDEADFEQDEADFEQDAEDEQRDEERREEEEEERQHDEKARSEEEDGRDEEAEKRGEEERSDQEEEQSERRASRSSSSSSSSDAKGYGGDDDTRGDHADRDDRDEPASKADDADEDEPAAKSKDDDAGDDEGAYAAELRAQEEAEMDQQFAREMAADADEDYDFGGGPSPPPQLGGFAADWD